MKCDFVDTSMNKGYVFSFFIYLFHLHQHTILLKSAIIKSKTALQLKGLVHNYVNSFFEVLRYWALKFSIFLQY